MGICVWHKCVRFYAKTVKHIYGSVSSAKMYTMLAFKHNTHIFFCLSKSDYDTVRYQTLYIVIVL